MKLIITIITFVWVGMVLGISFVEAPLKFRAPNITRQLGLGIGKIVFGALNKIEIVFSLILIVSFLLGKFSLKYNFVYGLVLFLLCIQTIWLIPVLHRRADRIIAGQKVSKTYHHILFIILEILKISLLLIAGIRFLKAFGLPTI